MNVLDEKMIELLHAKKISRKRSYRLNSNEIAYINSLPINEQIVLLKIEPMFVNYIKEQTDIHHDTIMNMKGLEMGNLHLNNLNANNVKKLCKKSIKFARNYINRGFPDIEQMVVQKDPLMFKEILLLNKELILTLLNKMSIYNFIINYDRLSKQSCIPVKDLEDLIIKKSKNKFQNSVNLKNRYYYSSSIKRIYLNFNYDLLSPQLVFFLHKGFSDLLTTLNDKSYYSQDNKSTILELLKKIEKSKNYDSAKLVLNMLD